MRSHGVLAIAAILLLGGCQQHESAVPDPPPSPAAATAQPKPGDRVDVAGIVVMFTEGGAVEISGRDRWGAPLDTSYETIEFFRNALPVLERSVSAEQAAGLRALVGAR